MFDKINPEQLKVLAKEDCFVGSLQTEVDFKHVKALPEKGLKTGKKSKCTTHHASLEPAYS